MIQISLYLRDLRDLRYLGYFMFCCFLYNNQFCYCIYQKMINTKKNNARIQKWRLMINQGIFNDKQLLKSRIRKGIPAGIRSYAWPFIINLQTFKSRHLKTYTYQKLIFSPSNSVLEISLDIPRTFPEEEQSHVLKKSLNNVLKAISIIYPKVGYCQGMNFLALRLLQIFDDEQTFWILNYLFDSDEFIMKNFIDPKNVEQQSFVFKQLMMMHIPKIQERFKSQNIMIEVFCIKWIITLYSSTVSQELFYRIFQIFLNEGWTIIYSVGLALLKRHQSKILTQQFEPNIFLINSQIFHIDNTEALMQEIFKIPIENSMIRVLLAQYEQGRKEQPNKSLIIKQRQHKNNNPSLPKPQEQDKQQLIFQTKSEQVTFSSFSLLQNKVKPF